MVIRFLAQLENKSKLNHKLEELNRLKIGAQEDNKAHTKCFCDVSADSILFDFGDLAMQSRWVHLLHSFAFCSFRGHFSVDS